VKLLLDQNLPHKLLARLADLYPGSNHVRNIGLKTASDAELWNYAQQEGYALGIMEEDFHVRSVLNGQPPKILWIRSGNCSTELVETFLRKNFKEIEPNAAVGFLTLV